MNWLLEPMQYDFMQRALLGCALIGFTNGFLSAFIVLRRLALVADAMSHSLLPGLALGVLLFGLAPTGLFAGALVAALIVGLGSQLISQSSRIKEETALGILYVASFSAGLILLTLVKSRVSLQHYLFGNILGISDTDLWITYGISLVTLPVLVLAQRPLLLTLFEPSIAASQGVPTRKLLGVLTVLLVLAMVSSLQAVGVVLSLGLLVAPAATVYLFSDSYDAMAWGGGLLGFAGSCAGLYLSYWLNFPSGACIGLVLSGLFVLSYLFSPRYGVWGRLRRRKHQHEASLARWSGKHPHS